MCGCVNFFLTSETHEQVCVIFGLAFIDDMKAKEQKGEEVCECLCGVSAIPALVEVHDAGHRARHLIAHFE